MFGKLLGAAINIASLPIEAGNAVVDVATGGSGKKSSRKEIPILGDIEQAADDLAEEAEGLDD